jgi:hypothetical protein
MVLLPALLQVIQQAIKREASPGLALPARDVSHRLHQLVVVDAASRVYGTHDEERRPDSRADQGDSKAREHFVRLEHASPRSGAVARTPR